MSLERRMPSGHTKTCGKPWRLGFTTVLAVTSIGEACPATKTLHPDWPWAFVTLAQVAVGTRAVPFLAFRHALQLRFQVLDNLHMPRGAA